MGSELGLKGFWIQKLVQNPSHPLILYWDSYFLFVQNFSLTAFTNLDAKSTDESDFESIFEFKSLWTYPKP
jgi:hypothetical protein